MTQEDLPRPLPDPVTLADDPPEPTTIPDTLYEVDDGLHSARVSSGHDGPLSGTVARAYDVIPNKKREGWGGWSVCLYRDDDRQYDTASAGDVEEWIYADRAERLLAHAVGKLERASETTDDDELKRNAIRAISVISKHAP